MSYLVTNPEDRFSHDEAQIKANLNVCCHYNCNWSEYNPFTSLFSRLVEEIYNYGPSDECSSRHCSQGQPANVQTRKDWQVSYSPAGIVHKANQPTSRLGKLAGKLPSSRHCSQGQPVDVQARKNWQVSYRPTGTVHKANQLTSRLGKIGK